MAGLREELSRVEEKAGAAAESASEWEQKCGQAEAEAIEARQVCRWKIRFLPVNLFLRLRYSFCAYTSNGVLFCMWCF